MENERLVPASPGPNWPVYLWRIIRHPLQASREMAAWETIRPGLIVVLLFGLYLTVGLFTSYLKHDYPPPAEELSAWIKAWGEFTMLPVFKISLEQYRLFTAILSLPVTLGSWILMAGSARLLTKAFGRTTTFDQYLNLFAFSFFPFWLLSSLGDSLFSVTLRAYVLLALKGQYGTLVRALVQLYPQMLYAVVFGLGGVYNGLAAYGAGEAAFRLRGWQAAIIGFVTFVIPLVFCATLFR